MSLVVAGIKLKSSFQLTSEQYQVLENLIKFINIPVIPDLEKTYVLTLSGSAGTGKTSLLKLLIQYNNRLGIRRQKVLGASLTHKARKVLDHTINKNMTLKIPTATVAALLKKQKQASFVGTRKFRGTGTIIGDYGLILIDEVSMIADRDFVDILKWAKLYGTKLIFIGDPAQIPHPTQELVVYEGKLEKRDSLGFQVDNRQHLSQIKRQGVENPITKIYGQLRDGLREETPYQRETMYNITQDQITGQEIVEGVEFVQGATEFIDRISQYFRETEKPYYGKIICYTNRAVSQYNQLVRIIRDGQSENSSTAPQPDGAFKVGDLLMGYENVGFPTNFISNGQEYEILSIKEVDDHPIYLDALVPKALGSCSQSDKYKNIKADGYLLIIEEKNRGADGEVMCGIKTTIFVPDMYSDQNYPVFQELIKRSDKVNKYGSTVQDFKNYQFIKEQLIFFEALYKWTGKDGLGEEIMGEQEFIDKHPLLRTRVTDLIKEELILDGDTKSVKGAKRRIRDDVLLIKEIDEKYPNLLIDRLRDINTLGDSEELKDKFQILSKDIDFGYAITAHKSQGSTYHEVFLDEQDFNKIQDRWNYKHNLAQRGSKERNQLKYVAFTRASKKVTVL